MRKIAKLPEIARVKSSKTTYPNPANLTYLSGSFGVCMGHTDMECNQARERPGLTTDRGM